MKVNKKNILDFPENKLREIFEENDIEGYRSAQVFKSLHQKFVNDFHLINNIPASLRETLSAKYGISYPEVTAAEKSHLTETQKFLFAGENPKDKYEAVFMKEKSRITFCISSQSGCNAGCIFCATGYMGFSANLSAGEIVSQVYSIIERNNEIPTNIVYMGMGEPFLNYRNVIDSLKILTSENGLKIPARKITVSTIGIKGRISDFADEITKPENKLINNVKLALSLHSTDEGMREKLIPLSRGFGLKEVYEDIVYFYRKTKNKITYEYIWFEGINDTENDIRRIKKLSGMVPCNFNVIPFHPVDNIFDSLKQPQNKAEEKLFRKLKEPNYSLSYKKLNYFIDSLRAESIVANVRSSNGVDISAACGQLALKN